MLYKFRGLFLFLFVSLLLNYSWGSWSIIVSFSQLFVFHSVHLNDGCFWETGIFPTASLAYCRWADKAVQPASWETTVTELSVGPEAHRLVFLPHSFFLFLSAMQQYLLAPGLCCCVSTGEIVVCFLVHFISQLHIAMFQGIETDNLFCMGEVE